MIKEHHYKTNITWIGNRGVGTADYASYDRSYEIKINHKINISGSSDAPFRGDINKHNPEDLFLSSISSCHMLWFLHLCADKGIVVVAYEDDAQGTMIENPGGGGRPLKREAHECGHSARRILLRRCDAPTGVYREWDTWAYNPR